jgi:hypothetical protein
MRKLGTAVLLLVVIAVIYEALIPAFQVKSVRVFGKQIYPVQRKK